MVVYMFRAKIQGKTKQTNKEKSLKHVEQLAFAKLLMKKSLFFYNGGGGGGGRENEGKRESMREGSSGEGIKKGY